MYVDIGRVRSWEPVKSLVQRSQAGTSLCSRPDSLEVREIACSQAVDGFGECWICGCQL